MKIGVGGGNRDDSEMRRNHISTIPSSQEKQIRDRTYTDFDLYARAPKNKEQDRTIPWSHKEVRVTIGGKRTEYQRSKSQLGVEHHSSKTAYRKIYQECTLKSSHYSLTKLTIH